MRILDLAQAIGIPESTLSRKERGKSSFKISERRAIAGVFGMTLAEFDTGWREQENYRARDLMPGKFPIINTAPAGQVIDYNEHGIESNDGYAFEDRGDLTDDGLFGVRIVGSSMEPTLHEGDIAVFVPYARQNKPQRKLEDGKIVYVRFSEDSDCPGCTIARFHGVESEDGSVTLTKDNPAYKIIRCNREDIEQLAVIVQIRKNNV